MATEADIKALEKIVEKLDDSIEKLTEVNNNIGKLLAVHEERMNNIEKQTDRADDDIRDLHEKINTLSRDLMEKMDSLDDSFDKKMAKQAESSTKQHLDIQRGVENKIDNLAERISQLEKWKYFVIGAAAVIGYLVKYLMG